MRNKEEEIVSSIRTGLKLKSLRPEQMVIPEESEWFWRKVNQFAKNGNTDPIGDVVKAWRLWPNQSIGESRVDSAVNQASEATEVDGGESQVLQSVLSAVKNSTAPSVTLKRASLYTPAGKDTPMWTIELEVPVK